MIIGIRRVCRAYEFCPGIIFGVSEVGVDAAFGAGGERDTPISGVS